MDCPMIMVHASKCYKALTDSGVNISLLQYSTYKNIGESCKTPIQPTMAKLNTANGSPMTALGMTAVHLRIAEFKFHPLFCNLWHTPRYRDYFWYRDTNEVFSFTRLGQGKKLLHTKGWQIPHTWNCEWQATIGTVKSTLKIPWQHNGVVPIKITGPVIKENMAYSSQMTIQQRVRDPNINIINGIHKMKVKNLSIS